MAPLQRGLAPFERRPMPVEHFKSKEAYRKNMAYRHMHGIPFTASTVVVGGKAHKVKHSSGKKKMRLRDLL